MHLRVITLNERSQIERVAIEKAICQNSRKCESVYKRGLLRWLTG